MADQMELPEDGVVLVTNDDGVGSAGLEALTGAVLSLPLFARWSVVVVAPATNMSGTSASIGGEQSEVRFHRVHASRDGRSRSEVQEAFLDRLRVFKMAAPPAVAVLAAYEGHFGGPLRFVASGVNAGLNVGWGVLHSGTVGAALTAQNLGIPSVAVSAPSDASDELMHHAAMLALSLSADLITREPTDVVAANVNVPRIGEDSAALATLARATGFAEVAYGTEPQSAVQIRANTARTDDAGSDAALLADGDATVTFLRGVGIA